MTKNTSDRPTALALLRERAGFATQTQASEVTGIDKGQLSRWENESPRPSLENLGRLLAGYKATLGDLVAILEGESLEGEGAKSRA